ncbi:hypothetical protein ACFQ13_06125 [Winogradskyella rapida]|uniref:Uncharacterized protein n=2 Tax=Winogradskyella rapida TaxID=549701 RepID=A0ABW3KPN6_9FLAO
MAVIKTMGIFSKNKYYIKLYVNKIEIKDLTNGRTIIENSQTEFNNKRLLIAEFQKAEKFVKSVFKNNNLNTRNSIGIVQQREMVDGGLSAVEKRVLIELFERAGIKKLYIDNSISELTEKQLIEYK